jgi:hypothetical protein
MSAQKTPVTGQTFVMFSRKYIFNVLGWSSCPTAEQPSFLALLGNQGILQDNVINDLTWLIYLMLVATVKKSITSDPIELLSVTSSIKLIVSSDILAVFLYAWIRHNSKALLETVMLLKALLYSHLMVLFISFFALMYLTSSPWTLLRAVR